MRNTLYSVLPTDLLEDDKSRIEEGMASAFVEYVRHFGPLSMQAGLRYENVDFDYYDNGVYIGEQSRVFNNVFRHCRFRARSAILAFSLAMLQTSTVRHIVSFAVT